MNRDDELFTEKLHHIVQQIEPAPEFRHALENDLRRSHQHLPVKSKRRMTVYLRRLTTIAAAFALLLTVILFVPPFRSLAQDIIDSLFTRAESNERTSAYTLIPEDERDVLTEKDYYDTLLTIEQADRLAGFEISEPTAIPNSYRFRGVSYSEKYHSAMLIYTLTGRGLNITQQPIEFAGQGDWPLGVDADIIEVEIGSLKGEYVQGGWFVKPANIDIDKSTGIRTETATWISEAPERRLRWSTDGMMYEIRAMGGSEGHGELSLQELIDIAMSMQ